MTVTTLISSARKSKHADVILDIFPPHSAKTSPKPPFSFFLSSSSLMTRIEELQRGIEAEATADFTALFCDGDVVDSGGDVTKSPGSKRKKKRKRQDGAEEGKSEVLQDPLEVFGSDMMMMILSYLDAPSVALSLLVSRGWHGVASSDRLWSTKVRFGFISFFIICFGFELTVFENWVLLFLRFRNWVVSLIEVYLLLWL